MKSSFDNKSLKKPKVKKKRDISFLKHYFKWIVVL